LIAWLITLANLLIQAGFLAVSLSLSALAYEQDILPAASPETTPAIPPITRTEKR
jgi:hypothetical protein